MRTKSLPKEQLEYYRNKKPIAVYPMTNWGGVEILDILYGIDDYVIFRMNFGEPDKTIHKVKIKHGVRSSSFRIFSDDTIRLDRCMRVG